MDLDALEAARVDALLASVCEDYFYTGSKYLVDYAGRYIPIDKSSLRYRLSKPLGEDSRGISDAVCTIEDNRYVSYCGPLAGRDRGLHRTADGASILATESPVVIKSRPGQWDKIRALLDGLFGDDEYDQMQFFLAWMKSARAAMLAREPSPAHLLALVGPKACGKTQLVQRVIKPAMGGRESSPAAYFSGGRFNGDLVKAELLVMDDETLPVTPLARQTFKQRVKNFLYSAAPRIEAKGQDAFTFQGLWRAVVCCNLAEDDLRALPPVDSGTEDKLIFLKCSPAFDTRLDAEKFRHWCEMVKLELPAFLDFVENYEVASAIRGGRGGVEGWQHPGIMAEIHRNEGWRSLLELVDMADRSVRIEFNLPWRGTAKQLETILTEASETHRHARKLLDGYFNKCGTLLGQASRLSDRVYSGPAQDGYNTWRIEDREQVEQVEHF